MTRADFPNRWILSETLLAFHETTIGEITAWAGIDRRRGFTFDINNLAMFIQINRRTVGDQCLGIRVLRILNDFIRKA